MNAAGIDVSKGKSMVAVYRPFNEMVAKPFSANFFLTLYLQTSQPPYCKELFKRELRLCVLLRIFRTITNYPQGFSVV